MRRRVGKSIILLVCFWFMIPNFSFFSYANKLSGDLGIVLEEQREEIKDEIISNTVSGNVPWEEKDSHVGSDVEQKKDSLEEPKEFVSYTIVFDKNNASAKGTMEPQEITFESGTKLNQNVYECAGYLFKGWNTKADGTGMSLVDLADGSKLSAKNDETVTLYAQWTPVRYSIKYYLNGGKNHSKNPASYTIATSNFTLQNPSRTGYRFQGWYQDKNFTKPVKTISKGSMGTKVLYAKWEIIRYSIRYHLNGGKNHSKNPVKYAVVTKDIELQSPTRPHYKFKGWYSDSKCTKRIKTISKGSTGNKNIYAKWEAVPYRINYQLNGGKNHSKNPKSYNIATSTIKLQNPTRSGYRFLGWYSDKKCTKKVKTIPKASNGNKTLYAKWEVVKYNIKYQLKGGKNHSKNPVKYTVNTKDIKLYSPTRANYKFKGWYSDSKYTKRVTKISQGSIGNKTLYACWVPKEYTITYHLNSGKNHMNNPAVYTMEDKVTFQSPVKNGYRFLGWYKDSKFKEKITFIPKGTKKNIAVYAKWEKVPMATVNVPKNYLNVCDYGAKPNDSRNDTEAFYEALKAASENYYRGKGATTVYAPAGTYRISASDSYTADDGIYVRSNTKLIMDNQAILYVEGEVNSNYSVIKSFKTNNITIQGGQIQGERYRHKGKDGESGHGINLLGCSNVTVADMSVASNWGDGIYLGTWYDSGSGIYTGNDKITIKRCEIKDNRRNNISIVDADNVTIERCDISGANGTAPQCGICIEPNKGSSSGDEICSNILLKDTTISAYKNINAINYWCFMTTAKGNNPQEHTNYVTAKGIRFMNCTFNGYVGNYSGNNLTVDKNTRFNGTFVSWRTYKQEK